VLSQNAALEERSRKWIPVTEPVSTSPLIFRPAQPIQNSMLQTGDAAAFVDPFVGDGISLALRSGKLAAECLVPFFQGECTLPAALARYAREYRSKLGHVLRTSSKLRHLLACPVLIRKPLLSVASKAPFITARLIRMTR
jgi:flavin-dependent dehydrogenase